MELCIRQSEAEGVGRCHMPVVVPAVAHQPFFGIVGNELLTAVVAPVLLQSHEDVALVVVVKSLRVTSRGIGGHIFEFLRPCHRQFA